jgi:ER membrane protein complex subunit 1, C-terminal
LTDFLSSMTNNHSLSFVSGPGTEWLSPAVQAGESVTGLTRDAILGVVLARVEHATNGVVVRAVDAGDGRVLWVRAACHVALAPGCFVRVASTCGDEQKQYGDAVLVDVRRGEGVEDSGFCAAVAEDAAEVVLVRDVGAGDWVFTFGSRRVRLVSDSFARLIATEVDSEKVLFVREESMAHVESAAFYDSSAAPIGESARRVLVVLCMSGGLFGLDVMGGGKLLWGFHFGEGVAADGALLEDLTEFKLHLVKGDAEYAVVVASSTVKSMVFSVRAGDGKIVHVAMIKKFSAKHAYIAGTVPSESLPCVRLLDSSRREHVSGPAACVDAVSVASPWIVVAIDGRAVSGVENGSLAWNVPMPSNGTVATIATTGPMDPFSIQLPAPSVRVTGSRKLLFKYMNSGMALVVVNDDSNSGVGMTAMVINTLTGAVVDAMHHEHASGPFKAVRCDNWFVYTFWNADILEQELHVIDMYESVKRPPWVQDAIMAYARDGLLDVFPSAIHRTVLRVLDNVMKSIGVATKEQEPHKIADIMRDLAHSRPVIARTSFLLTHAVHSLGATVSERGMTERALLLGLASGRVVELSRTFLDARRPIKMNAEAAAEQLFEYRPVLSLWPSESAALYAFYGQEVPGLLNTDDCLMTSPMIGRESSSHLAALGTDIVHSILAPAGKFDTLSDDFNYVVVAGTVIALATAVAMSRAALIRREIDKKWM